MNPADANRLIAKISWGCIPATVVTEENKLISLLLRQPSVKEQAQAANVYFTELQRAVISGTQAEQELLNNCIEFGQWSIDENNQITGLYDDIHKIRRGLLDFWSNITKLENARSLLRRAEKVLIEKLNKKHMLMQTSAEAYAEMCQQRFLIGVIATTDDGQSFWSTQKDFDDYNDNGFISQLCDIFFDKSRISISIIRQLARSQQWRSFWEIAKITNNLFENPVTEWSLNQRELAYWSTIYDSVYNAFDRPSKYIIDDDDLLDSWFIRQGEKIEQQNKGASMPQSSKPGRNEQFIMTDDAGAKRVYEMNDSTSRAMIMAKQKIVNKRGRIKEQDMPDSQNEMRQQIASMKTKHVKDIRSR